MIDKVFGIKEVGLIFTTKQRTNEDLASSFRGGDAL